MREILFRGERMDNYEWVEGSFLLDGEAHRLLGKDHLPFSNSYIVQETDLENIDTVFNNGAYYLRAEGYHVIPETVGQFTGLTDKNGTKIFEGDICEVCLDPEICVGKVIWDDKIASYNILFNDGKCVLPLDLWLNRNNPVWISVIGNIHDNPELLEGL